MAHHALLAMLIITCRLASNRTGNRQAMAVWPRMRFLGSIPDPFIQSNIGLNIKPLRVCSCSKMPRYRDAISCAFSAKLALLPRGSAALLFLFLLKSIEYCMILQYKRGGFYGGVTAPVPARRSRRSTSRYGLLDLLAIETVYAASSKKQSMRSSSNESARQ